MSGLTISNIEALHEVLEPPETIMGCFLHIGDTSWIFMACCPCCSSWIYLHGVFFFFFLPKDKQKSSSYLEMASTCLAYSDMLLHLIILSF